MLIKDNDVVLVKVRSFKTVSLFTQIKVNKKINENLISPTSRSV